MVLHHFFHFVLRPQDHRHALVQTLGGHGHDALAARGARAARLLDDEGHGIGLVHQAQLAAFFFCFVVVGFLVFVVACVVVLFFGFFCGVFVFVVVFGFG